MTTREDVSSVPLQGGYVAKQWPFSQHTSGDEPSGCHSRSSTWSFGLYVDGSLDCTIEMHSTRDPAEEPTDLGPPPLGTREN